MLIRFRTCFTHMFVEISLDSFRQDRGNVGRDHIFFMGNSLSGYCGDSFQLTIPGFRKKILGVIKMFFWFPS